MAVNKVDVNGVTVLDLTSDTVDAAHLAAGYTAHDKSGAAITGTASGGGETPASAKWNDVTFIDYDGSVLYSYTLAEAQALTELPALPSHDGLVCQGWNWTLEAIKALNRPVTVGAMYITDDGKTRIYIRLEEGRLAPYLGICPNGSVDVDWGDGSAHDTVTGTSVTTIKNIQHTYASSGDYVINLTVTGSVEIVGNAACGSQLLWKNDTTGNLNRCYQNAIQLIEIGAGVTSVGSYAFSNCYSLASIAIPSSVTSIGSNAFQNCYSLASVAIPDGVTSIKGSSFQNCYSLASVAIPDGVTSIGSSAFSYCSSLASVAIPDGVTSINGSAFQSCSSLSSIAIPDGVTSIGSSAFSYCSSLASVAIPDGVTSINGFAFQSCQSIASITIPIGVTSIGRYAFTDCNGLGFIKFTIATPPTVESANTWTNVPTDCIIYVPRGSLSAYTTATNYPDPATYSYVEY